MRTLGPEDLPAASCRLRRHDESVVVELAGEFDLYNAGLIRDAVAAAVELEAEKLVVDLAEVTFLDSTALHALLDAQRRLADRRSFALAAPRRDVRRALEVTGLLRRMRVYDEVEHALASAA